MFQVLVSFCLLYIYSILVQADRQTDPSIIFMYMTQLLLRYMTSYKNVSPQLDVVWQQFVPYLLTGFRTTQLPTRWQIFFGETRLYVSLESMLWFSPKQLAILTQNAAIYEEDYNNIDFQ
jgi:hypothetical protein